MDYPSELPDSHAPDSSIFQIPSTLSSDARSDNDRSLSQIDPWRRSYAHQTSTTQPMQESIQDMQNALDEMRRSQKERESSVYQEIEILKASFLALELHLDTKVPEAVEEAVNKHVQHLDMLANVGIKQEDKTSEYEDLSQKISTRLDDLYVHIKELNDQAKSLNVSGSDSLLGVVPAINTRGIESLPSQQQQVLELPSSTHLEKIFDTFNKMQLQIDTAIDALRLYVKTKIESALQTKGEQNEQSLFAIQSKSEHNEQSLSVLQIKSEQNEQSLSALQTKSEQNEQSLDVLEQQSKELRDNVNKLQKEQSESMQFLPTAIDFMKMLDKRCSVQENDIGKVLEAVLEIQRGKGKFDSERVEDKEVKKTMEMHQQIGLKPVSRLPKVLTTLCG